MKKIIFTIVLLNFVGSSQACDMCGFSAQSNFMGSMPQVQKNFIGLKFNHSSFITSHQSIIPDLPRVSLRNSFNSLDFTSRWAVNSKWQLFAYLPYIANVINEKRISIPSKGIGDLSLMASYIFFNTSTTRNYKQLLLMSAGLKIPTGNFNLKDKNDLLHPNVQPGSGSYDFPISFLYSIRRNSLSAFIESGIKINSCNSIGYKFGNRVSSQLKFLYWGKYKNTVIMPSISLGYSMAQKDQKKISNQIKKESYTGGSTLYLLAGMDIYYKDFSFSFNLQHALYEYLSNGNTKSNPRFVVGINYLF